MKRLIKRIIAARPPNIDAYRNRLNIVINTIESISLQEGARLSSIEIVADKIDSTIREISAFNAGMKTWLNNTLRNPRYGQAPPELEQSIEKAEQLSRELYNFLYALNLIFKGLPINRSGKFNYAVSSAAHIVPYVNELEIHDFSNISNDDYIKAFNNFKAVYSQRFGDLKNVLTFNKNVENWLNGLATGTFRIKLNNEIIELLRYFATLDPKHIHFGKLPTYVENAVLNIVPTFLNEVSSIYNNSEGKSTRTNMRSIKDNTKSLLNKLEELTILLQNKGDIRLIMTKINEVKILSKQIIGMLNLQI